MTVGHMRYRVYIGNVGQAATERAYLVGRPEVGRCDAATVLKQPEFALQIVPDDEMVVVGQWWSAMAPSGRGDNRDHLGLGLPNRPSLRTARPEQVEGGGAQV